MIIVGLISFESTFLHEKASYLIQFAKLLLFDDCTKHTIGFLGIAHEKMLKNRYYSLLAFVSSTSCDSRGIQTHNLLIRSQMLYSVELGSLPLSAFALKVIPAGFKPTTF